MKYLGRELLQEGKLQICSNLASKPRFCHGLPRLSFGKSYEQNFLIFILVHIPCEKDWCPHCWYSKGVSHCKLTVMEVCICHLSSPLQGGSTDNKSLLYQPPSHGKSSEGTPSTRAILRHYLSVADDVN